VLAGTGLIGIHLATGETSFGTHAACHGRRRGDDLPGARPLSGMTSNEALAVLSPERRRSRRALWRSMASSSRRARLDRTGATTLVALDADQLVGVVQLQSDGEVQAHLSAIVVDAGHRHQGVSRRLLAEALGHAGGLRIDVISR
jgi:ribosomal protein S18 acetylase RimI-like enzyme